MGLKRPFILEHITTIEQLRCAGVVAAVTLSRSAFPNRIDNKTTKYKFSSMWDRSKYPSKSKSGMEPAEKLKNDCEALLTCALKPFEKIEGGKTTKVFVVGKTRSYFRLGALEYLESNHTKEMGSQVVSIQRYIRGWFIRKDHQQADNKKRKAIARIQKWYNMESKEKELDDKEKRWTPEINELEEKCEKAEQERDDILEQIANEEAKLAAIPQLSDKDKKKLSESSEIITYVRKENKKMRSSTTKLRKDYDTMQENNKRLLEANAYAGASFEAMNEQSKKTNSNNSKLMQNLNKYKKQNVKLKEDLRMRSGYYDAEAQIRVNYQKSMAEIMEMI